LEWRLGAAGGSREVGSWPAITPTSLGQISVTVPRTSATIQLDLTVELSANGHVVAGSTVPIAIFPFGLRAPDRLAVSVDAPDLSGNLSELLRRDGHRVGDVGSDLCVASQVNDRLRGNVDGGQHALVVVTSDDALPPSVELERPVRVQPRWPVHAPGANFTWTGDWIGAFSWLLPSLSGDLPRRAPLDFIYQGVLPRHVITGYEPMTHADEVAAGMFVGWVHSPVALLWRFRQGAGWLTVTTFDLAIDGPAASTLRNAVLRYASQPSRVVGSA